MSDVNTDTLDSTVNTPDPEETTSTAVLDQATSDTNVEVHSEENVGGEEITKENTADDKGVKVWYDQLPADMQGDPNIQKYKSLDEYVKGNRELVKMIGKDKVVVPTENSTQEEKDAFYTKMGRPEEAAAYTTPTIDAPAEVQMTDSSVDAFKAKAFELGLSQSQYEQLYSLQSELSKQSFDAEVVKNNDLAKTTETALRSEYGAAYETKVETAQNVINKYFAKEKMHPAFSVLSNDKGFVRAMSSIGESLGEDTIKGEAKGTLTPDAAQLEMNQILGDNHSMSKAYYDDMNPEHQAAVDHVLGLQRMIQAGGV